MTMTTLKTSHRRRRRNQSGVVDEEQERLRGGQLKTRPDHPHELVERRFLADHKAALDELRKSRFPRVALDDHRDLVGVNRLHVLERHAPVFEGMSLLKGTLVGVLDGHGIRKQM
ncbi:hypothetical protein L596_012349 [Steinernema carpocapsae]|uniref:Uncharacterized protein n=1 Tax=Steinernema carpocapsae TaxID=34508 RepID=A0A4U5NWW8_STECR|nr:hypothetical protein L596_012349 [Steinernema carpocapsae]